MARVNPKTADPDRYNSIAREQQQLIEQYATHITMARICPYCGNKVEILCKGSHDAAFAKCTQCAESVFFPPVSFRLAC